MIANLQSILMVAAALAGGIYALTGFTRVPININDIDGDGDKRIVYAGSWRRNLVVTGVLVLLAATLAIVPKGHVGVVYDLNGGIQEDELPEGLNFVVPFKQHVTNVDVRLKAWVFDDDTWYVHTEDFHEIRVPFAVNWRIDPTMASHVLKTVAGDPADIVLSHAAKTSVRNEVGLVRLDDLAQSVEAVADRVAATITPQATRNGLIVQFVAIEDAVVRQAYTDAVEQERISERNIRTAANLVQVAENEAQAVIRKAEGEAQAIETVAVAREQEQNRLGLSPSEYVWYTRWDGILPRTLLGESAASLILDLQQDE